MIPESKEQFMTAVIRLKKASVCLPESTGMQFSELAVMHKISTGCALAKEGFSVSEIQRNLHISKPAVSQILNNLEKKGFIVRSIDSGDRRKITVTLTRAGQTELSDAMRCQNEILDKVLDQFGAENTRTLIRLINRLMDIVEKNNERCDLQ